MELKTINEVKDKKVLLRVDFNVPMHKGKITDDSRIRAALPTINYLLKAGARIILMAHLGRPEGKRVKSLMMKPIGLLLRKLLPHKKIIIMETWNMAKVKKAVDKIKDGEIIFLENLRFEAGEEKNNVVFAKMLAELGDIYVNEAFSDCHRAHASIVGITKFLPSYAGLLLAKEVVNLSQVLEKPQKPLVVLMGGAKISTKIGVIQNLSEKAKYVLLGGALVNNLFQAQGFGVGDSLIEPKVMKEAKNLLHNKRVVLPIDVVVAHSNSHLGKNARVVEIGEEPFVICRRHEAILDIGPETIKLYAQIIRKAKTIVWNGPMGYFEIKKFSHGSVALGRLIASRSKTRVFGVIGGGETLEVYKKTGMPEEYIDHISTGGGAMLEFLEGKILPGIKVLLK